ncbi:lipocalin-like domain-containing protein [Chamaesiphon polymorphus]|uniref:Lipocalin-like domain-containing protein n=1 Tax=Chamaesiphon polymorphus CCALA 037 TaxID=2107692 RepID=A0A2T1G0H4_9CYAN|nr:lipocalin-like domain-containing protein [Chamaesiphon polymorphus]PSB50749.1 hypothetical protein C7B77_22425 [Chamaesiphon polymorphus CCALA 037]
MTMQSTENHPLVGIWKLLSAIGIDPDGTIDPDVYGANPIGYITYTETGKMMVMFSRSDRPPLSRAVKSPFDREIYSIPIEECGQAFLSFNAYAGRYQINGDTITHFVEISSIPNRVGTQLVRTFTLNGNHFTLTTPSTPIDGVLKVFKLMWERF